jgi:Fe-S oxidoreductase
MAEEHNTADWKCVPFDYYGWRRYTPSAFWELATRYYHGLVEIDDDVRETLFSCAQCGLCNEVCGIVQDGTRLSDIFKAFRFIMYEQSGPFRGHGPLIENIKRYGNEFGTAGPTSAWAAGLNLRFVEQRRNGTLLYAGEEAAYRVPQVARAAAKVLTAAGVDFGILKNEVHSGYDLEVMGDRWGAEELWRKNAETFKKYGVKNVVCLSAPDYHVLRRELGAQVKVEHITEHVATLLAARKLKPKRLSKKVTYHDPCYLARQAGSRSPREHRVIEEPRKILAAIPGVELLEMPKRGRWTWCAGECGGIKHGFPDLARWRAQKLIEDAKATGAEVLLTATPPEQLHLEEVLASVGDPLPCMDVMEVLAEAL